MVCLAGIEGSSTPIRPIVKAVILKEGKGDMLVENGGRFKTSTPWIKSLSRSQKWVMRVRTTAAQKLPVNVDHQI